MNQDRDFSEMKIMWAIAMFDLPVKKKTERRYATQFRKHLLAKGFTMLQFSIYAKFCSSRDSARSVISSIKATLPPKGNVRIALLTDKQFGDMYVFTGQKQIDGSERENETAPEQLMLF
ncbi:MAG: CRISPR-associated endonuclease Cas2 [Candidatus Sabulitectum sp.]|nr:CRISPR-associated endonuclease Cas2 [Candidatus Sabulitectum sp.]